MVCVCSKFDIDTHNRLYNVLSLLQGTIPLLGINSDPMSEEHK